MLTFKLDQEALTLFGRRFRSAKERQVRRALGDIRQQYIIELQRQEQLLQGFWAPLGEKYFRRKSYQYLHHLNGVKYYTILKRTGVMMDKYLHGVRVDENNFNVVLPYPRGTRAPLSPKGEAVSYNMIAKVHQGLLPQPRGSHGPRPFLIDRFEEIGKDIMIKALTSRPSEGDYKGYQGFV